MPAANPPTCAHQATPPTSFGPVSANVPLKTCASIQNAR
jgi:hypothetical protein